MQKGYGNVGSKNKKKSRAEKAEVFWGDAGKYPFKLWSDDIYDGKSADAEDQKSCQADSSLDLKSMSE